MKNILIYFFLLFAIYADGQSNLVVNGGFEVVYSGYPAGPAATTESPYNPYYSDEGFSDNQNYWAQIEGWTYPDPKLFCSNVPSADVLPNLVPGAVDSYFGDKYGHCDGGEYLVNPLIESMRTDHIYYVEFYVRLEAAIDSENSIGLRFFKNRPKMCEDGVRPSPDGVAHITMPDYTPTGAWVRKSMIIKPTEDWGWICLGDFVNDKFHQVKSFWDDVKILDLGEGQCPYQWVWENTTFDDVHYVYQASNLIYAGYDFDNAGVYGPVVVKANSDILFRSGDAIVLDTGFITEPGSYFETEIAGCTPNPCPFAPDLANDYFFCDSIGGNIGTPWSPPGIFYHWSPSTYLNEDTAANPLFNPPTGIGQITYIVTITSVCGYFLPFTDHLTEEVTVGWDSDPSPVPSISLSNITTGNYDFSFDAAFSEHTEQICISFLESGTGNTIGPYCIDRFDDFDCCSLTVNYEDIPYPLLVQLSACRDYEVIVTAKNFCFENTAADTFSWDRVNTLSLVAVPNIVTLRNPANGYSNGLNDEFCIQTEGADSYEITVSSTSTIVNSNSGPIVFDPQCIWDGKCHYLPNCTSLHLATGSYAVIVEVSNDCGQSASYNDFVVIAYDEEARMLPVSASTEEEKNGSIRIFPNPASDQVYVHLPEITGNTQLFLRNSVGQQLGVFTTNKTLAEISVTHLEPGIYFLGVEQGSAHQEFRFVVSR